MSFIAAVKSIFTRPPRKPRIYLYAPNLPARPGSRKGQAPTTALILPALNQADSIVRQVEFARERFQAVIVLDQGSSDGTPHLAAEAGATVVLCEPGQDFSIGIGRCAEIAFRLADQVVIHREDGPL